MDGLHFIQLIGVLLTACGMVALGASAKLFGTRLERSDRRRSGNAGNTYSLPINIVTLAGAAFLLGGIGILVWSKFDGCSFLGYWIPNLPEALRMLMTCQ